MATKSGMPERTVAMVPGKAAVHELVAQTAGSDVVPGLPVRLRHPSPERRKQRPVPSARQRHASEKRGSADSGADSSVKLLRAASEDAPSTEPQGFEKGRRIAANLGFVPRERDDPRDRGPRALRRSKSGEMSANPRKRLRPRRGKLQAPRNGHPSERTGTPVFVFRRESNHESGQSRRAASLPRTFASANEPSTRRNPLGRHRDETRLRTSRHDDVGGTVEGIHMLRCGCWTWWSSPASAAPLTGFAEVRATPSGADSPGRVKGSGCLHSRPRGRQPGQRGNQPVASVRRCGPDSSGTAGPALPPE